MNDEYVDFNSAKKGNTYSYNGDPRVRIGSGGSTQFGTGMTPVYVDDHPNTGSGPSQLMFKSYPSGDPVDILRGEVTTVSANLSSQIFNINSKLDQIEKAISNMAELFDKLQEQIFKNSQLQKLVEEQQNTLDILQTEVESINSDLDDIREKV